VLGIGNQARSDLTVEEQLLQSKDQSLRQNQENGGRGPVLCLWRRRKVYPRIPCTGLAASVPYLQRLIPASFPLITTKVADGGREGGLVM
jgi:hypothetical protein